jgi:hypothetical protein
MGTQSVLHTKGQGGEISFFFTTTGKKHTERREAALRTWRWTWMRGMHLKERSGLGGDVDWKWEEHMEDTEARPTSSGCIWKIRLREAHPEDREVKWTWQAQRIRLEEWAPFR